MYATFAVSPVVMVFTDDGASANIALYSINKQ